MKPQSRRPDDTMEEGDKEQVRTAKASLWDKFRKFDAHPKTSNDFRIQTTSGAVVSVLTLLLTTTLFANQISLLLGTDKVEHMKVDDVRNASLKVNINITFHEITCGSINMAALDASNKPKEDLMHHIVKQRIDKEGNHIGDSEKDDMKSVLHIDDSKEDGNTDKNCGSCYGAGDEGQCCNTCDEIRQLYKRRGWEFHPAGMAQCVKEGIVGSPITSDEGCTVEGYVVLPKVTGQFYFAPRYQHFGRNMPGSEIVSLSHERFNTTHTIHSLSFGTPYPGVSNPLDGVSRVLPKNERGMHQYYLKIVPTEYHKANDPEPVETNQYSVTDHFRHLSTNSQRSLPGVYFFYQPSPIRVIIEEKYRSVGHFLTSVCAIIGGVFTVMGMIDQLVYSVTSWWENKKDKASLGLIA